MVRLLGRCIPVICIPRKKRQSLPICEEELADKKNHQDEVNKLFVRRVESIRVMQKGAVFKRFPLQSSNERNQQHKKTKSKATPHNSRKTVKPDDTEFDCETHISDRQSNKKARVKSKKKSKNEAHSPDINAHVDKLLDEAKKPKKSSPIPFHNTKENQDNHNDSTTSLSSSVTSDWSTTTYPDSNSSAATEDLIDSNQRRRSMPVQNIKSQIHKMKHQSCLESFCLDKQHVNQVSSSSKTNAALLKTKNENHHSSSSHLKQNEKPSSAKSKQVLQNVRKMISDQSIKEQHFNDTRQRESVRL